MSSFEQIIMKIPFYTILGPMLKKNKIPILKFCSYPALRLAPIYVAVLGVLGVVLSIFDIVRIVKCGPVLPGYLLRERLKNGKLVSPEAERDCKLISLVLSTEYYAFLLIGLMTNNPVFYMPFLVLYAFIVILEFLIFFIKLFVDGIDFKKSGLIMSALMIFNWMSVFCTFARSTSCCDL